MTTKTKSPKKPMKWKKLEDASISDWEPGEEKEFAEYLGFTPSEKENMSGKHKFRDLEGVIKEEWDCAVLRRKLQSCPVGAPVKLKFLGKKKGKNGTHFKDFDVFCAEI
jgi:hypothetical protein